MTKKARWIESETLWVIWKGKKNFHLFYSLTKLTSILFQLFYTNMMRAVKREHRGRMKKKIQFVTMYIISRKKMAPQLVYVGKSENRMMMLLWYMEQKLGNIYLLILHEIYSKNYIVAPNGKLLLLPILSDFLLFLKWGKFSDSFFFFVCIFGKVKMNPWWKKEVCFILFMFKKAREMKTWKKFSQPIYSRMDRYIILYTDI